MSTRTRTEHRGTTLIARAYKNGVHGKAWCHGREIATAEGVSEEDVIDELRRLIDDAIVVETEAGSTPYPEHAVYELALSDAEETTTAKQRLMLLAHFKARNNVLTGTQLAEAASFPNWTTARQQYGILARSLSESMMFQPLLNERGVPTWILVIATPEDADGRQADTRWTLREPLANALEAIKFS